MSIAKNIRFLRKKHGFTQETFAQALDINRPSVGAYEEDRAYPKLITLSKMAELFSISVDELINEDLTVENRKTKPDIRVLAVTVDNADNEFIQLVPIKAAAGYSGEYSNPGYLTNLPKFHLPVLPKGGTYRAFEIQGDSMLPITSGSIVVGKYLENFSELNNGQTYILVTKTEGIVYKRVFNYIEERGSLYLVSDNSLYKPYEVAPAEISEIWQAKAFISLDFPDPKTANELSMDQLANMLGNLKSEIDSLKSKK